MDPAISRSRPRRKGFPAHAGMDPSGRSRRPRSSRFPRTRGDGPWRLRSICRSSTVSPHTRGWTLALIARRRVDLGFPAHAGMDPRTCGSRSSTRRFPRTRGDGPRADRHHPDGRHGFPAHAGMDPGIRWKQLWTERFPRTRGDGPRRSMRRIWQWPVSRTRGDGPCTSKRPRPEGSVSPHTRGWTLVSVSPAGVSLGFPAHAGMDPSHHVVYVLCCGFPRTRGDGPYLFLAFDHSLQVPRTRGDGPGAAFSCPGAAPACSTHTRGWTRPGRRARAI